MTNAEAIHVINQVRDVITKNQSWMEDATRVVNEAADMAIKALEAQKRTPMNADLISRAEAIRINLNEPIKVKLTDWGKEIYYHQYDRTNQIARREICKPRFPKEDENGYTEFQLWCFMELYGEYIGMTLPNVIEPLEIVYEGANRNDD